MSENAGSGPPAIPPGWYDDPSGTAGHRWWDGTQWTSHVQTPVPAPPSFPVQPLPQQIMPQQIVPQQAVQQRPGQQPLQMAQRITDGVQETRSVWWIAFSPLWSVVGQCILVATVLALLSLPLADVYPELIAGNVLLWALVIGLAFLDRARLRERGSVSTASPLWVLLTPVAYLIARAQHVRLYGTGAWTPVIWWCVATVLAPGLAVLGVFAAYGIFTF